MKKFSLIQAVCLATVLGLKWPSMYYSLPVSCDQRRATGREQLQGVKKFHFVLGASVSY